MSERPAVVTTETPRAQSGQGSFAWEDPPRSRASATSPVLIVAGFEGPLDWLLDMVRAKKIDLARLSILALVEAFAGAMDAALTRVPDAPAPELTRWADWTVMATHLTELRSRLLLPADAPDARTAQTEAEALRQQWICRAETAAAADWLEQRPQLGLAVFARGRPETVRAQPAVGTAAGQGEGHDSLNIGTDVPSDPEDGGPQEDLPVAGGDLTDLLRACLVALRLPPDAAIYQPRRPPFWSFSDAAARITRLLDGLPAGATLAAFLPAVADAGATHDLRCRAALSATFVAGLELTRGGALTLDQEISWRSIHVRRRGGHSQHGDGEATVAVPLDA